MTNRLKNTVCIIAFFLFFAVHYLSARDGRTRRKRLLDFPEKTNVVLTMSLLKLFPSDTVLNTLTEYDVAFPVPLHPYKLPNKRTRRQVERGIIHGKFETISNIIGFKGENRLANFICAVKNSFANGNNSEDNLLKDVMDIVFNLKTSNENCA